ncbi:NADH-quinone oxidoreductase subunit NuoE [Candidatus Omnitrophota bacterium]
MIKASVDVKKVEAIIKRHKSKESGLVGMLQEVQGEYNYLPKQALTQIARSLKIPLSQAYSLATFYKAFSLQPRGKYLISVCMGTACHVRRSAKILEELERNLKIKAGETTADSNFSLETVNCLGACALGPLMVINGEYYGNMTAAKVKAILKKYKK